MSDSANHTLEVLKAGGIVIFPTDTAYGIGCRIDNHKSVDRVFAIRERPASQATPVLVSTIAEAMKYFDSPPQIAKSLMQSYWPGALTIIARVQKRKIYALIRGGGDTIGFRMPDYPELLEVITKLGVPIIGTSANIHGRMTPYSFSDLDEDLVQNVDYVWKGRKGSGHASTVVECIDNEYKILRQGSVILQ